MNGGAPGVVIVGGGQAGIQLADSLRTEGYNGPIDVFATEAHLPYQRPPLSKDFLGTADDPSALPLRAEKFFAERDITFHRGVSVTGVDAATRLITSSAGDALGYAALVLATGARNRQLAIEGVELDGVHYLRTLDDATALRVELERARTALVVGGGFIGLEFAASASQRGVAVTVLERGERIMGRVLSEPMSRHFSQLHGDASVAIRLGEGIARLTGVDGHVTGGVGTSGALYAADLVVVGIGVEPNVELGRMAGVGVSNGIEVDSYLRTSDPFVYAIGDCCSYPNAHTGTITRLESVQNAVDQAKVLAKTLTGQPTEYVELPWFWSQQGADKLQIAGIVDVAGDPVLRGDPACGKFSVFCFRGDHLLGVESVNNTADHLAARRILSHHLPLTVAQAADPLFDLKAYSRAA
ncbi:NAD(P)/FAD-dependent oxidoreductase [Subtercola sp. RTI3]|uniref:NAD(P)/FAD-dependent oxidoreductase n=1 Tax=Subtercola sp. RTI3 TaxID=3048639 RepID=UPI002B228665|nr:FAD-dependent oxidoreductase [Subtercola sp. RTI3]MEA9984190.1 FAD-dependent oxidoreductase [Subtercola sp. RTI3]